MPLADFQVTVGHDDLPRMRAVRVIVYDTLAGLRAASTRYENARRRRSRRTRGLFGETLGICHRFEHLDADGESVPLCAIVRLARPHLGAGIITHELAHAAVWIHELDRPDTELVTATDEPFCWVLGELVRATVNLLYEDGIYDT